jgi:hypothetical protein
VYGCVCDTVRVELDVADEGIDALRLSDIEHVGDPVGDLFKLDVKSPVADKLAGDEGDGCVDGVKPNEGVARGVSDTV